MNKYLITYSNGATESTEAYTISEAITIRVYTKHPVSKVKRLGAVKSNAGHMSLFN